MWAGFLDGCVIGLYHLPPNVTGDTYLNFLEHVLHVLLEGVPLQVHQNMWFQHDGAPPHFTREVRGHLELTFGQTRNGRSGPTASHAHSPDLTPLDYFLWGHMKSLVYETFVDSEEDVLARVMAPADVGLQGIGDRVHENIVLRYFASVQVAGRLRALLVSGPRTTTYSKQQKWESEFNMRCGGV